MPRQLADRIVEHLRQFLVGIEDDAFLIGCLTAIVYRKSDERSFPWYWCAGVLVAINLLLVALLAAIVVQGLAANITNVYTAGLSLVNSVPRLGRVWATVAAAVAASAFSI